MTNTTIESNNMNIELKNVDKDSVDKTLSDAEIAIIELDKGMNALMISKQDR